MNRDGFVGAFTEDALKEANISLYPKELHSHKGNFGIADTVGEYTPISTEMENVKVRTGMMNRLVKQAKEEIEWLQERGLTVGKTPIAPYIHKEEKLSLNRVMDVYGRVLMEKKIAGEFDTDEVTMEVEEWQSMAHNMLYLMDIVKMDVTNDKLTLLADDAGETLRDVINQYWELKKYSDEKDYNRDQMTVVVEKLRMALFAMLFVIWRVNHNTFGGHMSHKMLTPGNIFFTQTMNKVTTGFYPVALNELGCSRNDLKYLHPTLLKLVKRSDLVRYFGAPQSDSSFREFDVTVDQSLRQFCPEADMWSFGILIYEFLRNEPFPEIDSLESFYSHIDKFENISQNAEYQKEIDGFDPIFRELLENLFAPSCDVEYKGKSDVIKRIETVEELLLGRDESKPTMIEKLFNKDCERDMCFATFMVKGRRAIERTRYRV